MMLQRAQPLSFLAFIGALLISFSGFGIVGGSSTDSLKRAVAEQRILLHQADSAEDVQLAIAVRLHLATMVKPKEAIRLLEEGAALARSTGRVEDEVLMLTYLARSYAAVNDHRKSYMRSLEVIALNNELASIRAERSGARTDSLLAKAKEEHMATIRADMLRQMEVEAKAARQRKITERWMIIALGLLVVAVLVVLILLFRGGKRSQRTQAELAGLRAEVAALRLATSNRVRETAPDIGPEVPVKVLPEQEVAEVDETIRAMFLKRAPERLATLREARSRNDHEKVVRVVHTLKPQLVALDTSLGQLCMSITAPSGDRNDPARSADLDRLEKAIERLLI